MYLFLFLDSFKWSYKMNLLLAALKASCREIQISLDVFGAARKEESGTIWVVAFTERGKTKWGRQRT